MTGLPLSIRPERPVDAEAIERLHERAFGPGRFARTAFRLREGVPPDFDLSFVAFVATLLVGSNRITRAMLGEEEVLVLGPLTVEPAFEGRGIGAALMDAGIEAARAKDYGLIFLVGDLPYYARFGFKPVPTGQVRMPGPVDPGRFLVLELKEGAFANARGELRAAR